MIDSLAARLKLKRANMHARTLNRETRRFLNAHEIPTFLGRFEANFTRYTLYVRTGYPDPPESFSVRFGDAIYNYRCALDHIAWQLVLHGNDPSPRRPQDVQFPIYSRRRDFNSNVRRRLPGVDPDAVKFIESRNALPRWNSRHNILLHLADLTNEDKHRNVQLVASGIHELQVRTFPRDCINLGFARRVRKPPQFKEGAKVCTFAIKRTGPNPKMDMDPANVFATVSLRGGLIANAVLFEIRVEVETILNAPKIAAPLA